MSPPNLKSEPNRTAPGTDRNATTAPSVRDLGRLIAQQSRISDLAKKMSGAPGVLRRPQKVPRPGSAGSLDFSHIDVLLVRNGALHIAGWAFVPEWDPSDTAAFLCIESSCLWFARIPPVSRPDVQVAFTGHPEIVGRAVDGKLAHSGFHGIIEVAETSWPDGEGTAWFALMNRNRTVAIELPAPDREESSA